MSNRATIRESLKAKNNALLANAKQLDLERELFASDEGELLNEFTGGLKGRSRTQRFDEGWH